MSQRLCWLFILVIAGLVHLAVTAECPPRVVEQHGNVVLVAGLLEKSKGPLQIPERILAAAKRLGDSAQVIESEGNVGHIIDSLIECQSTVVIHQRFIVPTEGGTWGYSRNGIPAEHGAGLDGDGESGVHAESARVGG